MTYGIFPGTSNIVHNLKETHDQGTKTS